MTAGLGLGRFGAADFGELVTQSIMPTISSAILRRISSGVVPLQVRFKILKCSFGVVRECDTAAG